MSSQTNLIVFDLPPVEDRLDAANSAQLLSSELQSNVGEALDLAGSARPGPGGVPGNGGAAQRVHTGALSARGVVALTPEVVVNNVAAGFDGSPLVAEVGSLGEGLGREGGCATQTSESERKKGKRSKE